MSFHVSMVALVNQMEYVPVNQAGREIPAKVMSTLTPQLLLRLLPDRIHFFVITRLTVPK